MSSSNNSNQTRKKIQKFLTPISKNTILFTVAIIDLITLFSSFLSPKALTIACDDSCIGIAYTAGEAKESA